MHITRISRTALTALCVCGIVLGLAAFGFAEEAQHAAAGHEGGHGAAQMKDFIWRCVDFAALVLIAVWAVKKADVKGTLAARSTGIKRTLEEAVAAKEAAEKKFQEYNTRMDQANKEIEEISANMKREGQLEKERIIAEANQAAARIVAQAGTAAEQEVLKAKSELRAEAAKLAVELAEQKIVKNIAKGDQDKLVGDYISKVVTLH